MTSQAHSKQASAPESHCCTDKSGSHSESSRGIDSDCSSGLSKGEFIEAMYHSELDPSFQVRSLLNTSNNSLSPDSTETIKPSSAMTWTSHRRIECGWQLMRDRPSTWHHLSFSNETPYNSAEEDEITDEETLDDEEDIMDSQMSDAKSCASDEDWSFLAERMSHKLLASHEVASFGDDGNIAESSSVVFSILGRKFGDGRRSVLEGVRRKSEVEEAGSFSDIGSSAVLLTSGA